MDPLCRKRRQGGADVGAVRALLLGALPAAALLLAQAAAAQPAAACEVRQVVGAALVLRGGATLALRPGMPLQEDDQIVTAEGARLAVGCADGSRIAIGEGSSLSLAAIAALGQEASRAHVLLDLLDGILRFTLAPGPQRGPVEVRTATAVAAVRSTDWVVEAEPGSTAVFVVEGEVRVSGRAGGMVALQAGFGTDVPLGAQPTLPKRWGPARVESALARTRVP